ncbi:MAG: hypothetical protein ACLT1W_11990 [Alistipes onderdonkii]
MERTPRGGGFGYNFFILLMKVAGIRSAYAFLSLVVVYFIPFAPAPRGPYGSITAASWDTAGCTRR